jgi:outer membrane protein insertion porin family
MNRNDNILFRRVSIGCKVFPFLLMLVVFNSCISSRLLNDNEYLYVGAIVKVHSDSAISGKKKLASLLNEEVYPLPNQRVLGLPYKLWIYSISVNRKKNGTFIGNNYGEPPVLMTDVPLDEVTQSLHTVLKANGYLKSRVKSEIVDTKSGKQQQKVIYHCYVEPPYFIRDIKVEIKDPVLVNLVDSAKDKSLLHPGDQYNLEKLRAERERIDKLLKNQGYYYFSPDFLIFYSDTIHPKNPTMDLFLNVKPDVDSSFLKPWHVNRVMVVDNSVKDTVSAGDTVVYKDITFLTGKRIKPKLMRHFFLFGKGDLLTSENYSITNKNLSTLNALKYVNLDADPDSAGGSNLVDISVELTPNELYNVKAEGNVVSKSNDFAGPGADLTFTNRNLGGGGEQLILKANGSIEAWLEKKNKEIIGNYNYEFGVSGELKFPRFLLLSPMALSPRYVPDNHIRVDLRYVNQMQFYKMSFFRILYGYRWTESEYRSHELNIIDVTYQHLLNQTDTFNTLINKNSLLKQSFADQFMLGSNYTFQYAVPDKDPRRFKTAFIGSLDLSGNLFYGIQRLTGRKGTETEPLKFLGTQYAQYVKTTVDYRMYLDVTKKDRLAARISAGVGLPVGNSGTLPGIKQYYLGGANSIRAFRFRSVGPGTYADTSNSNTLINHSGEIMMLGNIENRFKLTNTLEWAVFLDAGNIWLVKNDTLRTGAQFNSSTFLKQLAVGWGTGLRYLNQYFTVRLDVGFPLRYPNTTDKISNALWQFAIGYPF